MIEDLHVEILQQETFFNVQFCHLNLDEGEISHKLFEGCQFDECSFRQSKFSHCKFIDCNFKSCNLSSVEFNDCYFSKAIFRECKAIGINWTKARWPYVQLTSPIEFYKSNISFSSFYELSLKDIIIEGCKAHSVDFREGDFSNGSFVLTDLDNSLFVNATLLATDFTEAYNYNINPFENKIKKAKFSMPDAINLLLNMDIELQE